MEPGKKLSAGEFGRAVRGAPPHALVLLLLFAQASAWPVAAQQDDSTSPGIAAVVARKRLTLIRDVEAQTRVEKIVGAIFRVADKEAMVVPEIAIVAGRPTAQALDGRYILVSQSMVKLLPGDDELAIVLGHEIAHLVKGHTAGAQLETDVSSAAKSMAFDESLLPQIEDAAAQALEAAADRYGLLYAALAGYDVSGAQAVYDKVLISDARTHPPKAEREKIFRTRLQDILNSVDVFRVSVDFMMRGKLAYAIQALEQLVRHDYRSHEIYHNLATVRHWLALRLLPSEITPPGACSLSLELASSLEASGSRPEGLQARGTGPANWAERQRFVEELGRAIRLYTQALLANSDHAATRSNLGCAYLHRQEIGDIYLAAGELERASGLDPASYAIANNLGVAYLYLGRKEEAVASFRRAIELHSEFAHARYNLGLALADSDSAEVKAESRRAFEASLAGKESLHTPCYAAEARRRLGLPPEAAASGVSAVVPEQPAIGPALPVFPGTRLSSAVPDSRPVAKVRLIPESGIELWRYAGWQVIVETKTNSVDQITLEADRYRTPAGIGVGSTLEEVRQRYGVPEGQQSQGSLQFWGYLKKGLMFRFRDGRVVSWAVFEAG